MADATKRIVFAGGGTGGHLFPAIAVADALGGPSGEFDISFRVTNRPIDPRILESAGYSFVAQGVLPFPNRPGQALRFLTSWRRACEETRREFENRRPCMVIGSGGFAAGPPLRVAQRMGIPTGLLNPDAVPGRANRYLARRADQVYVQWEETRAHFPKSAELHVTGCPIRREFIQGQAESASEAFGLSGDCRTLLVTGASQGAHSINLAMIEIADLLSEAGRAPFGPWQVLHLTGPEDHVAVESAYQTAGVRCRVLAFTEKMASALSFADLVVSRAGASTLAEITALGKPSLLLPYPYHRDQHQHANAHILERAGAAILLDDQIDPRRNAQELRPGLKKLLMDVGKLKAMGSAARRIGRPGAAQEVAALVRRRCACE